MVAVANRALSTPVGDHGGAPGDEPTARRPEVHEVRCRTVLNRVKPPMPFRWSANPYRGCQHACAYCYARPSHATYGMEGGADFERHIFVKTNAPEVLRAELRRPGWNREAVSVGTIVDPYQPVEGRYRITRGMLAALAAARTPATIITKNTMILRDIDVLRRLQARAGCAVFVSVTTLDAGLARRMEPGTPPPLKRLAAVERLVAAGIPAGVLAAPLLPGMTDSAAALDLLAAAAAGHGAAFFAAGALRLGPNIDPWFYPFLRRERPDLLSTYRRLYTGTGYAPPPYVAALHDRVAALRDAYALPSGPPPLRPTEEPAQLGLAW
ncbi:MAG TPA: radical SAM protein [Ktedonobacterales bacterium]|jgi:DNA repair photolyase